MKALTRVGVGAALAATGIGVWYRVSFFSGGKDSDALAPSSSPSPLGSAPLTLYRSLPLRALSRLFGHVSQVPVPSALRAATYRGFCSVCGCDSADADRPLREYRNIADFFSRAPKEGSRPVDERALVVSPCDGRVMATGQVSASGTVEQVKGLTYSLRDFLGADGGDPLAVNAVNVGEGRRGAVQASPTALYYICLYLSPSDCHSFVSPAQWHMRRRRHIAGELLSVNPAVARRVPQLLESNERVVLLGRWPHGLFSLTAVGATNVGGVRIFADDVLTTNRSADARATRHERFFGVPGHAYEKGDDVGAFRLGSSIVLAFEAPADFRLRVQAGEHVRRGRALGA